MVSFEEYILGGLWEVGIKSTSFLMNSDRSVVRFIFLSLRVKDIYNQAVLLYKEKQYEEAYKRFQEVEELMPHYARTDFYLQEISKIGDGSL